MTRASRRPLRAGSTRRRSSSSRRSRTCASPPTSSGRSGSARTASTAGSRSRCRRGSRTTPTARSRPRSTCTRRRTGRTCSSRSPRPPKHSRDRGGDLRRCAGQRHAAVLARAVPRRVGCVPARDRAARRGRPRSARRLGGVGLRQSLGHRARVDGAPGRAAQPARHRDGEADLPSLREMLDSDRWRRLANEGARPQRLLWASTGTKDPAAPDILYVRALAAPFARWVRGGRRCDEHRERSRRGSARVSRPA